MKIKSKIFKRKSGKSEGKWIARVEYFDEVDGRTKYIEHTFDRKTDAVDDRNREVLRLQSTHGRIQSGDRMKFSELAQIHSDRFYQPPVIKDGRRVAGVRSFKTVRGHITMLRKFFGARIIRHITSESLIDYRLWRLKQGSQRGKNKGSSPVSIATVNRELSTLRTILSFAVDKDWLVKGPSFRRIIDGDAETARDRLLTIAEEERLLAACQGERLVSYTRKRKGHVEAITAKHSLDNPQLKAIILLAIDGGLRRGEILKLRWQDIDLENYRIHILATHTKTERARYAPLSERARDELLRIRKFVKGDRPFPFNNFSGAFETAKRLAKVEGLRFHDLRRTAITRWIQGGNPLALAGKLAGHSQLQTTQKHYITANADMVTEMALNMNAARQNGIVDESDLVN